MVARTAYTQLDYSPLLLAGTVLGHGRHLSRAAAAALRGRHGGAGSARRRGCMMSLAYLPMVRFYRPLAALGAVAAGARLGLSRRDDRIGVAALAGPRRRMEGAGAMAERALNPVETPSGKGAGDENFPVGSFLIRRELRAACPRLLSLRAQGRRHRRQSRARRADEKVRRLDRMGAVLDGAPGDDSPAATAMRASLLETGITPQHCHDVLRAFRLDATKLRYRDWDDLMEYCRYSASPVGRQLLDLHGEDRATWPANDALCSALQVLNHLQDCGDDYRESRSRLSAAARTSPPAARAIEDLRPRKLEPGPALRHRPACSMAPTG